MTGRGAVWSESSNIGKPYNTRETLTLYAVQRDPEFGAQTESRTRDLRITNALLYQLSYLGGTGRKGGRKPPSSR
jgi:hypothetical protein